MQSSRKVVSVTDLLKPMRFPILGHRNAKLHCHFDTAEGVRSSQRMQKMRKTTAMNNTDKAQAWLMAIVGLVCLYASGQMGAGYTALASAACAWGIGFKWGRNYRDI